MGAENLVELKPRPYEPSPGQNIGVPGNIINLPIQNSIDDVVGKQNGPTYNPMKMDEAVGYFRKEYLGTAAEHIGKVNDSTGKFNVYDLAGKDKFDYDRGELSGLIEKYDVKPTGGADGETKAAEDIASKISDPIVRRVFRESVATNDYSLSSATKRFKDIYVNSIVREIVKELAEKLPGYSLDEYERLGVRKAADVLDVHWKTVRNNLNRYRFADYQNSMRFSDDLPIQIDLEKIAARSPDRAQASTEDEWFRNEEDKKLLDRLAA
jgi:hypothetical protein